MGWTTSGLYDVASAIEYMLQQKAVRIVLYWDVERVKELEPTISVSGNTVLIHAEDSSSDEYEFSKVAVEDVNGERLIDFIVASQTKNNTDKLIVDVTISVSGA